MIFLVKYSRKVFENMFPDMLAVFFFSYFLFSGTENVVLCSMSPPLCFFMLWFFFCSLLDHYVLYLRLEVFWGVFKVQFLSAKKPFATGAWLAARPSFVFNYFWKLTFRGCVYGLHIKVHFKEKKNYNRILGTQF